MIHCEQEMIDNQSKVFLNAVIYPDGYYEDDEDDDGDDYDVDRSMDDENDLKVHKDVQQ